jgi:hypothetical protein
METKRVIFCASEKMIKRFVRAHNKMKSVQGVPRSKKQRTNQGQSRSGPGLTADNLKAATTLKPGSVASNSLHHGADNQSIYSGAPSKPKPQSKSPIKKKNKAGV